MDMERLKKQIDFIKEIDKAKSIYRQTLIMDGSRRENDAEHSWHLAVMAMLLYEYVDDDSVDVSRVIKMALIHDLVEIYAGDTFCYDEEGVRGKKDREKMAADKLFGILPRDQAEEFRCLWEEFERMDTKESRFAASLDRLQPLIHNCNTKGHTWREYNVPKDKVVERNERIKDSSTVLWKYAMDLIDDSVSKGYLKD